MARFDEIAVTDQANVLRIAGNIDEGLIGIAGTNWSSVPVTGRATFRGLGVGAVTDSDLRFRGDAVLTVDFGEDDITGGLRNIVLADGQTTYLGDGAIVFSNGDLGITRPTDFTVDYAGTLAFGDDQFEFDGNMDGLLRGTRLGVTRRSPIKALSAEDTDGEVTINGVTRELTFTVVGETP